MTARRPGESRDRWPHRRTVEAGRARPGTTLLLGLTLTGCASPLGPFERALARQDSATVALGEWCKAKHIADPPTITAHRIAGDQQVAPADVRRLLQVGANEPLGYRHVELSCGDAVLSVAHNWYLPARLTPEMNRALETDDTPFGRVVAPLGFTRKRLEEKRGPLPGCPSDTVLTHRALLELPDGRSLSALTECYTRANLR